MHKDGKVVPISKARATPSPLARLPVILLQVRDKAAQQLRHGLQMQGLQCSTLLRQQLHQRSQILSACEQRLLALQAARAAQTVTLKNAADLNISSVADVRAGEVLQAQLADGRLQLQVLAAESNASKK